MALRQIVAFAVAYSVVQYVVRKISYYRAAKKGKEKLKERNSKVVSLKNIDQELKEKILSLKAYEIVEAIQKGELNPEDVLYTYIERAVIYGRKYNNSAEEPFEDALSRLENLPDGILKGLPISIKDNLSQIGCNTTGGLVWRLGRIDTNDNILVTLIKKQGGLPFVRGNALQIMMWFETDNNIYGQAQNPWDPTRTVGGSSGGDAGLVASRAAILGIGSDIAGSIRIPSAFCGIYGFRPTARRANGKDGSLCHPEAIDTFKLLIKSTRGPMGRCVEDLTLILKSWWTEYMWKNDPYVTPLTFNNELYQMTPQRKLKIGYFDYNGVFECAEVIKDILRETRIRLENEGHELVRFDTSMFNEGTDLFARIIYANDPACLLEELQGEEPMWAYKVLDLQARFPFMRTIIPAYLKLLGHKQLGRLVGLPRNISLTEFSVLFEETSSFKERFNRYWNSLGIDALICPIWPLVAPQHEKTITLAAAFSYSFFWNLVDFPAGVMPIRTVRAGEDKYETISTDASVKACKEVMENSVGLPVSLQVVGYPNKDEEVLGVMKIIESFYKFDRLPI